MANDAAPICAIPRRRWVRYSLRTLMVLVTALCVWLTINVNAARRRADAVVAIHKAGGTVWFDYQLVPAKLGNGNGVNVGSGLSVDPNALQTAPAWLRHIFGDDFFRTAVSVQLIATKAVIQSNLTQLAQLPELKAIDLTINPSDSRFPWPESEEGLAVLGQLTKLKIVAFDAVDPTSLACLERTTELEELSLQSTPLNGNAMRQIGKLQRLRKLTLQYCDPVDNDGIEHLAGLDKLEVIGICNTRLSDAGVMHFKALKHIKSILLVQTDISNDTARQLQKLLPQAHIISRHLR
jgi:hypothetical protein